MFFLLVILLLVWMIVLFCMILYFLFLDYNLFMLGDNEFIGFLNYEFFLIDFVFVELFFNIFMLVGGVLVIMICGGIGLVVLFD